MTNTSTNPPAPTSDTPFEAFRARALSCGRYDVRHAARDEQRHPARPAGEVPREALEAAQREASRSLPLNITRRRTVERIHDAGRRG